MKSCRASFLFYLVFIAHVMGRDALRPPAVPLVTHTPYFSVWSANDRLTDGPTRHWTGAEQKLASLIRVDGKAYRLMGAQPDTLPALPQKKLEVLPTRTTYFFGNEEVEVTLSFLSPLLPQDLDVFARPVSYLTWKIRSVDGKAHEGAVYFDAAAEVAVDRPNQTVACGRENAAGLIVLKTGSEAQQVLGRKGDDLRIDWGCAYVAAPEGGTQGGIGNFEDCVSSFIKTGKLPAKDSADFPKAAEAGSPVLALALNFGTVADEPASRFVMIAYDEIESIQYFHKNLKPYWRRRGMEPLELLKVAAADYDRLHKQAAAMDGEMMSDLRAAGGQTYAEIGALAYRQAIAAHALVADENCEPLFFSKENFSNGCIATVDVTYPSAPLFLLTSPTLMKAMIVPILDYASGERWKFPFAPHDLGTYPLANGQVYGGGEQTEVNQMPVEECGNMILLVTALARVEGDASFAARYWPVLTRWAEYLAEKGFDPENQLCTDDFAGHLAHNVNLSTKAIEALGGYAMLCQLRGDAAAADKYEKLARKFAERWMDEAGDGTHTRLAFDKPGTWSQKYNLVWDRLLQLNLFPPDIARRELAYYRQIQNAYGLPLDIREDYTKLDWIFWSATLTPDRDDFVALIEPIRKFLNETPDRSPMTDWYETKEPKRFDYSKEPRRGFTARSVVGGVFIKLLDNPMVWKKWSAAGGNTSGHWAKQPMTSTADALIPTAQ